MTRFSIAADIPCGLTIINPNSTKTYGYHLLKGSQIMGSITIFYENSPSLSEVLNRRLPYIVLSQTVAINAEEVRGDQRVLNPHCGTLFSIGQPLGCGISL